MTPVSSHSSHPTGQPYDNTLKLLMEGQEEEILQQILPGARYVETLNIEQPRGPMRVDRAYRMAYRGEEHILDLEFETASDSKFVYRLLEYHAYFLRKYELPVISLVVYPFPTTVVESPLMEMSGKEPILAFHFFRLLLWKLSAETYVQNHVICMYSLLPTMHGANAHLLIQALNELAEYYRGNDRHLSEELLRFSLLLHRAELIPPEEKRRVEEKLSMWDHLIEQDPRIQQIRAESELIGENRGEARGVVAMQGAVLDTLQERFPLLAEKARMDIESIQTLDALRRLIVELSIARDEASAQRAIAAYLP